MPQSMTMIAKETVVLEMLFGRLALEFEDGVLVASDLFSQAELLPPRSKPAVSVCQQIKDYGLKKLPNMKFDIPLQARGTDFQKRVWRAMQQIPYGQVKTYGELALKLNTSARAVGNACRANPIPLIIPCHRVVAKTGLGGFHGQRQGEAMQVKSWLLKHEGVFL